MAPEVLRNDATVDEKSDVFSYGVVLFELVTGEEPWGHLKNPAQVSNVGGGRGFKSLVISNLLSSFDTKC